MQTLKKYIAQKLLLALKSSYPTENFQLEDVYKDLTFPPSFALGHYAYPCFSLSKKLKKAPMMIAAELAKVCAGKESGPYVNITVSEEEIGKIDGEEILNQHYFSRQISAKKEKIMFEYSQPNTHKELHVGHMRNLCLGNALVRIGRYVGHDIIATTYPGDVGTHVAKTLWYLKFNYKGEMPVSNKGTWLGEMYSRANNLLEDEKGTPKEDKNRAELTKILKELESGKGEYFDLWKTTREWSIDLMKEVYDWADVKFDRWFFESEVDKDSVAFARKLYQEGKLILDQGAIGMNLEEDKLGFCMLLKTDGTGLYATKDVMLAQRKFEEFNLDQNIYVVDKRQAHHFKQVFKVLEKLGVADHHKCYHLAYDFVELPEGAMSSRQGNIIPLTRLTSKMEMMIEEKYLTKYRGVWDEQEISETAKRLADGAIKFGMCRIDPTRKIVFDLDEWLKLDGETGPYLQYVYARIMSLLSKQNFQASSKPNWNTLTHSSEKELLFKLTHFNDMAELSFRQHKTNTLCSYLYDLGKLFNHFYVECPIGKLEEAELELKETRLLLAQATALVIKQGLNILGIKTVERM
jgi:arginyl-tRNA synthetase